jgi:hypothetical protein
MQTSKRLIFDRISKYFPFDQPYYLLPAQPVIQNTLKNLDMTKLDKEEESESNTPMMNPLLLDSSSCIEIKTPRNNYMTGDDNRSNYTRGGGAGYESSYYQIGTMRTGPDGRILIGNSEIDLTTSGPEESTFHQKPVLVQPIPQIQEVESQLEDSKMEIFEEEQNASNKSVLYEPNIDKMVEAMKMA